jgi:hypothetical protein
MRAVSPRSRRWRVVGTLAAAGAAGCLTGEDLTLGHDVDASARVEGGSPAVQDESLGASIETPPGTTGTICAGQCVPLHAAATGGDGSYTYTWDDDAGGSEGPDNDVCPTTTTTYSVIVGTTASEVGATASLTITVIACDAGGSGSAPDSEAPSPTSSSQDAETAPGGVCVTNPSFEGATVTGTVTPGVPPTAVPMDWVACMGDPTVDPTLSPLPAETGGSFVGLPVGSGMFADVTASLGTTLCATLQPGEYSFCIGVGVAFSGAPPQDAPAPVLQIWGGSSPNSPCDKEKLLWTSDPISNTDAWAKVCPSFFATEAITNIILVPTVAATIGTGLLSYVIVDDIVAP